MSSLLNIISLGILMNCNRSIEKRELSKHNYLDLPSAYTHINAHKS